MKKIIILYDNWCPICRQSIKIVELLDWFNLIDKKQLRNNQDLPKYEILNLELATQQMASYTNTWNYGFISIFYISIRLPVFWIFIPFLFILKISGLGQFLYKELALKRKVIPIQCDENSCNPQ